MPDNVQTHNGVTFAQFGKLFVAYDAAPDIEISDDNDFCFTISLDMAEDLAKYILSTVEAKRKKI